MGSRKRMGTAGRFGPRYGKKVREKVAEIEALQKRRYTCPRCKMDYVRRVSTGVWKCEKCGAKFAGKAYAAY